MGITVPSFQALGNSPKVRLALNRLVTEDVIQGAISRRILFEMFPPVALCCGSLRSTRYTEDSAKTGRENNSFGQSSAGAGIGPVP